MRKYAVILIVLFGFSFAFTYTDGNVENVVQWTNAHTSENYRGAIRFTVNGIEFWIKNDDPYANRQLSFLLTAKTTGVQVRIYSQTESDYPVVGVTSNVLLSTQFKQ